jgi:hypothetical protein
MAFYRDGIGGIAGRGSVEPAKDRFEAARPTGGASPSRLGLSAADDAPGCGLHGGIKGAASDLPRS